MTRLVLINTHWAFDVPYQAPPNFVVTGQLIKPSIELAKDFERKDSALKAWMDQALE